MVVIGLEESPQMTIGGHAEKGGVRGGERGGVSMPPLQQGHNWGSTTLSRRGILDLNCAPG